MVMAYHKTINHLSVKHDQSPCQWAGSSLHSSLLIAFFLNMPFKEHLMLSYVKCYNVKEISC